jgi:serine/threonine-protein kinase
VTGVTNLGKYQIVEPLDESGPIAVYTARGPLLDRLVVIQLCRTRDQALRDRFLHQAEQAGRLQHRNIVATLDLGFDRTGPYLVEELLSGEDLADKIARREAVSLGRRLGWLRQVALGLDHAHRREAVHGGVGPRTVRVLGNDRVKVRGFGVGWLHGGEAGAPPDRRADLRGFGALAHELLARRSPSGAAAGDALAGCPEELVSLVERCLERGPAAGYTGFSEVIVDLTPVLTRERAADRARIQHQGEAQSSFFNDRNH